MWTYSQLHMIFFAEYGKHFMDKLFVCVQNLFG